MTQSKLPPSCSFCGKKRGAVFCGLNDMLREKLDQDKSMHQVARGQVLFYEGSRALALYCIHRGQFKTYKTSPKGDRQIIRLPGPGDVVGFRSMITGEAYSASVEALDDALVCVITRETFLALLGSSPEFSMTMLRMLATELRVSEDQTMSLLHHPVKRRTAQLLLDLTRTDDVEDSGRDWVPPGLQRNEMAQVVGTTPETFSRTLRALEKQELIDFDRMDIKILDREGLRKIAR